MRRAAPTLLFLLANFAGAPAFAAEKPIVVLLHAKGPNFDKVAEGFRHSRTPSLDIAVDPGAAATQSAAISNAHPDVIVAVGQEAEQLASSGFPDVPRVIALASNSAPTAPAIVVSPEVPAEVQVKWISDVFPDVTSVGIVFDPRFSQTVVDNFVAAAATVKRPRGRTLTITPIEVKSESEVPRAFNKKRAGIQALLFVNVSDTTVMTKDTILYLLTECVKSGIAAIGFSRGFLDNGAVLAFVPDMNAVGAQAADAASKLLADRSGNVQPPKMGVWVNKRVADKLGLRMTYDQDVVKEFE